MRKMLSILLIVTTLLTLLPISAMALPATHEPLSYNEGTLVVVEVGASTWCKFTPTVSQTYQIYSYDSDGIDPVGTLYDSAMTELAHSDDYGGRDFRLSYNMTAGATYYLDVYDYGKDAAGTVMIMVTDNPPTDLYLAQNDMETFTGTQYTLEATVLPDDADQTLTWSSSDESIATVDENGVVTFLKGGEVTITAESINGLTDSCEFVVTKVDGTLLLDEVQTITVTEDSAISHCLVFTPTETGYYCIQSFDIVSDPEDPEIDPKVSVYDEEYRQVGSGDDDDGRNFCAKVALKAGQPYFCHMSIYYEDALGSYKVVAQQMDAASSIAINSDHVELEQGEYAELSVSFAPEGCWEEDYTFTSSDESVVEVSGNRVYAVGGGEAVVTVISSESDLSDTVTVTVKGVPEIELDTTYIAYIPADSDSDRVRYVFKPTESGVYTIASDEAVGEGVVAWVVLYDTRDELRSNPTDSGSFRLTHELEAGETYYYDVFLMGSDADRSLRFVITKEDETAFPQAFVNIDYEIDITNPGDGAFYMFKPTMTGEYTIFSSGDQEGTDPKLFVYNDEWYLTAYNDDGADDEYNNYSLTYEFQAGKTYYLKNIIYYTDGIGSYTMRIEPEFELMESATVSGTVSGIEGDTPVVIWFIEDGAAEPAYEVILEGNGDYEITDVPLGTYTVQVTAMGYETLTMTVDIEGNTTIDFEAKAGKPVYTVWLYLSETDEEPVYGVEIEEGGLVVEPAAPGKEGKIFIGWYSNGELYDFSTPVTEDLKLVAMWEDAVLEFVTQPTGGVAGAGNGYRFTFETSLPITQATLEIKNPTSSVWFTDNNAKMTLSFGTLSFPSAALCLNNKSVYRIKVTDGKQTVYSDSFVVTWVEGYTVSFEANGGTGTMDAVSGVYGTYLLPECTFTAPAGKQFKTWRVGNILTLIPGKPVSVSANVTLTAIWEDIPSVVTLGDVTGDGQINMMDVMALYNGASGKTTLTDAQKTAADMDGNGQINMMDVMALYNKVSGK